MVGPLRARLSSEGYAGWVAGRGTCVGAALAVARILCVACVWPMSLGGGQPHSYDGRVSGRCSISQGRDPFGARLSSEGYAGWVAGRGACVGAALAVALNIRVVRGSPVRTRSFFVQFDPFGAVCSLVPLYPGVRFAHPRLSMVGPLRGPPVLGGVCRMGGGEGACVGAVLAVARILRVACVCPISLGGGQPHSYDGRVSGRCSISQGRDLAGRAALFVCCRYLWLGLRWCLQWSGRG